MSPAEMRAQAIGDRAARRQAERLAAAMDAVPGVRAEAIGDGVAIEGRGLMRRALDDPRLRWPGGMLR